MVKWIKKGHLNGETDWEERAKTNVQVQVDLTWREDRERKREENSFICSDVFKVVKETGQKVFSGVER